MHSLDLTALTRGLAFAGRPNGAANKNEEYALVSESSDDFVDLRKLLVMSPLLSAGMLTRHQQSADKFSLSASLFGAMLEAAQTASANKKFSGRELETSSALIPNGADSKEDATWNSLESNEPNGLAAAAAERPQDAWTKFNGVLLKYLNDYSHLIKLDEKRRLRAGAGPTMTDRRNQLEKRHEQLRRSSSSSRAPLNTDHSQPSAPAANDDLGAAADGRQPAAPSNRLEEEQTVRRTSMLTFACMAHEANPMSNLSFEWYFGAVRLAAASQTADFGDTAPDGAQTDQRPQETTIYSNANESLSIVLTRRLDSGAALSPFQVSFITVSVIAADEPQASSSSTQWPAPQSSGVPNNNSRAGTRNRSFYQAANSGEQQSKRRAASASDPGQREPAEIAVEISEFNWRERLAQLLSCSVSNSVGTSDACYVRPLDRNALRRRKLLDELAGASSSQIAKWRMPSLAQKSVLIISLLIGCSLIVFATFALLLGPHLRGLPVVQKKRRLDGERDHIHSGASTSSTATTAKDQDQDQNTIHTANSTSSQKSSVLGLLGNAAEQSFPSGSSSSGSGDDDSTNRLNHQLQASRADELTRTAAVGQFDYDLPRAAQSSSTAGRKLVYQPDAGTTSGEHQIGGCYENYRFHYDSEQQRAKLNASSTGNRILASLKSKFKVQDRIADLPSGRWSGLLHARNVSSSETATTGLSLEKSFASEMSRPNSTMQTSQQQANRTLQHSLGVPVNLRHSYAGARPSQHRHLAYKQPANALTMAKSGPYYPTTATTTAQETKSGSSLDEATYNRLLQLNSQVLIKQAAGLMASSTMQQQREPLDAMDEFMRRRGFDTLANSFEQNQLGDSALAYGSQSIRNQSSSIYALRNDLIQLTTTTSKMPARAKPPVYPRAAPSYGSLALQPQNYPIPAVYKPRPVPAAPATRNSQQMFRHQNSSSAAFEHNLVTPYSEPNASLIQNGLAQHQFDTIDTHLNRFSTADTATALAYYNTGDQHQLAYANMLDSDQQAFYNQHDHFGGLPSQTAMTNSNNQSVEHIYDMNAYATPEQTPARRPVATTASQSIAGRLDQSNSESERLRVSQLIQTFNTKLPENSP